MTKDIPDNVLVKLEPHFANVIKYYKAYMRDEIKQEIRIRLWKLMLTALADDPDSTEEDLYTMCMDHLYSISIYCSKIIRIKGYYNYNKHYCQLDDYEFTSKEPSRDPFINIDLEKYRNILTKKEYSILEYLYEIDSTFSNFDEISRQLGYTGKGSFKYTASNIATKINNFNKKRIEK